MGILKDAIEEADLVGKVANRITIKAAKRARTRLLLMATVGIVILGSYLGYLTHLLGEYQRISDEHNTKFGLLVAENQDKRTLDYIELCIEASKTADSNIDLYCTRALELYKMTFRDMPDGTDENIHKSAYGAMKADVASKIRSMALERIMGQTPEMDKVLNLLLSISGIVIAIVLAAAAMLSTMLWTWRIAQSQVIPPQSTTQPPTSP